jgi:glycosyltransferase involved in cell wall biosynthesis
MKVLHVYRTYFPDSQGGGQEAIRQICLSTQALGVENTVFTLSPNPSPKIIQRPEATVVRCRSWAAPASCDLGSLDAMTTFRTLVKQTDVVHYLFPWPFADLLHELAPTKPSVLTYVSDVVRQKWLNAAYAPLMWRTLKGMNAIISNAPNYMQSSTVLSDSFIRSKLRQIPLGKTENVDEIEPDQTILKHLNLDQSEPFILFVGVFRYYKGLHTLIDACQTTTGRVVVVGEGPEGARLKAKVAQLGLKNITFTGRVSDPEKMALIQACRALVLPSHLRSEAYGLVLVEASMCSKPMVTCDIGTGTSYINLHNQTGFVVSPESPIELAQAMNSLLADSKLAESFGHAARERYDMLFSGEAMGQGYLNVFNEVLNSSVIHKR